MSSHVDEQCVHAVVVRGQEHGAGGSLGSRCGMSVAHHVGWEHYGFGCYLL